MFIFIFVNSNILHIVATPRNQEEPSSTYGGIRKIVLNYMYLLTLPNNCPTSNASENDEIILFRIFEQAAIDESEFKPYVDKYKEDPRWKQQCDAYAVSFYTEYNLALDTYNKSKSKNNIIGNYIAKLKISPKIGKIKCNKLSGHCNFWFYSGFRINQHIICLEITKIEQ